MSDLISRQEAKDAIDMALDHIDHVPPWVYDNLLNALNEVPSAEPKTPSNGSITCVKSEKMHDRTMGDLISRKAVIELIRSSYPSAPIMRMNKERWEKKYKPYIEAEKVVEMLPSAEPEIIRCGQCKYAEAADSEDSQDGYTCQFHRGSIWFSGSYCSWAERRGEEE